jgi:chemotaxis signal transduction protein
MEGKFLTFHLAEEDYGIAICYVAEKIWHPEDHGGIGHARLL